MGRAYEKIRIHRIRKPSNEIASKSNTKIFIMPTQQRLFTSGILHKAKSKGLRNR